MKNSNHDHENSYKIQRIFYNAMILFTTIIQTMGMENCLFIFPSFQ